MPEAKGKAAQAVTDIKNHYRNREENNASGNGNNPKEKQSQKGYHSAIA
ncbi:hypothetical protein [Bacillus alkalicellulosilyticus]|nr:hypothetical protein [Bacillus alkalicellulosilyticus]